MFRFNKKWIYLPIIFIFVTGFFRSDDDFYFELSKSIDVFGEVYKYVATSYVDDIDPKELMTAGIDGMLSELDPYTVLIEQEEKGEIDLITTGKYGGIGATVGLRNDNVTIIELIEGYSAQRQGLHIGDIITEINNTKLSKENYKDLGKQIKGEPGSILNLLIKREGVEKEISFAIVREEIEIKNLTYYGFLSETNGIAYLKLTGFTITAGDEIRKAIVDLRKEGKINSVVLDLRGNPGGLLDAAIDVTEKFVKKGELIVTVKGRDSINTKSYYSQEEPILGEAKLIVLVDNGSASASEIVAGAIQDHDRGVILGTQSFGKGLVQTILSLPYNNSLKITTAKYYTPSGRCIQKIDYSKKSDVIAGSLNEVNEFLTDGKRKVFSSGGIKPDTMVTNKSKSSIVNELMAKGVFFNFANYLQSNNMLSQNNKEKNNIFSNFVEYVKKENIDFKSDIETKLADLQKSVKDEGLDSEFTEQINTLLVKSKMLKDNELNKYKNEILNKINEEIVLRLEGRNARVKVSLNSDKQVTTATSILQNTKVFNTLLSL